MSLKKLFKTSPKLETEGVTLELGNCRIQVARAGGKNVRFNAVVEQFFNKNQRAIQHKLLSEDRSREFFYEAYAETVILDWHTNVAGEGEEENYQRGIENIFDENAEDLLPVTKENIVAVFRELPDLFREIKTTAEDISLFRQELLDDAAKN